MAAGAMTSGAIAAGAIAAGAMAAGGSAGAGSSDEPASAMAIVREGPVGPGQPIGLQTPSTNAPSAQAAPAQTPPLQALATMSPPPRQLHELPKDELDHLAEAFGLNPGLYRSRQLLVAALHERRLLIANMDRGAMLDVLRWGRRPVTLNATPEQIAQEIVRIKSMRFHGLSKGGLTVLARLRGIEVGEEDAVPVLIRKLKKSEGWLDKIARKQRALLGSIVANMVGESAPAADDDYAAPPGGGESAAGKGGSGRAGTVKAGTGGARASSIKEDIEESGLFGGISNRIKKTADQYLNQKLDEIEARIDRKLDEIDRRLAEWRDKEIANRIRILKITLWASAIVGIVSLIYEYMKVVVVK
jgi:hypothetical protein